MFIMTTVSQQ